MEDGYGCSEAMGVCREFSDFCLLKKKEKQEKEKKGGGDERETLGGRGMLAL